MSQYRQEEKDAQKNIVPFKIINNMLIGENCINSYINIGDLILAAFNYKPNFIGQIDAETGEEVTFKEMRDKSVKLAMWLKKRGIKENDVITICTRNRMRAYIPLLAGIYLNLIVNPWDYDYLQDYVRTLYFLLEYNPDVIFIDSENLIKLKVTITLARSCKDNQISPTIIVMDETRERYEESLDSILNSEFNPSEVEKFKCAQHNYKNSSVTMFSSTTANYPGQALIPYGMYLSRSNDDVPIMRLNDVGLWYEQINWTYSVLLTIRVILWCVTAVKVSTFSEENLCQLIEKYKVSWVFLKSSMCNKFNNTNVFEKYNVSSLKQFLFGDTAIIRQIHEGLIRSLPQVYITQVYGLSETGIIAYQRKTGKIGSSGYVNKNVRIMFIGLKTRLPVSANRYGEIWCQTLNTLTATDMSKSLQSKYDQRRVNEGWYYTGDIGYFDRDGEIFVVDKAKDMIKYKGFNISPRKIEEVLQCHPDVVEVVVVGVENTNDGQHAKAFVIKNKEAKVTENELIEFVNSNIDNKNYFLHGGVSFVRSMPYLPNGRIDRTRIKFLSHMYK